MEDLELHLKQLRARITKGTQAPTIRVKALPLGSIETIEDIFQHRTTRTWTSDPHIEVMTKALVDDSAARLEAIKVFWIGDAWCVIDGHHRLKAYECAMFKKLVPVEVFKGTLEAAVLEALRGNSRNKLSMSNDEKLNSAWKLTILYSNLSKPDVAAASAVSPRTVANMRRVRDELIAFGLRSTLLDMTWNEARMRAMGIELEHEDSSSRFDYREYVASEGLKLATRLAKAFGKRLNGDPNILGEALRICNESFPNHLYNYWSEEGYIEANDPSDEFDLVQEASDF